MTSPPRKAPLAGGFIIAAFILIGALVGAGQGQPSAGLVIGAAVGGAIALLLWWRDRAS